MTITGKYRNATERDLEVTFLARLTGSHRDLGQTGEWVTFMARVPAGEDVVVNRFYRLPNRTQQDYEETSGFLGFVARNLAKLNRTGDGSFDKNWDIPRVSGMEVMVAAARFADESDGLLPVPPPESRSAQVFRRKILLVDDSKAKVSGSWKRGSGSTGFVGKGFRYAARRQGRARFEFTIPEPGRYEVQYAYKAHDNRASNAAILIGNAKDRRLIRVNMKKRPPIKPNYVSLGVYPFVPGKPAFVEINGADANGFIHIDAARLVPVE